MKKGRNVGKEEEIKGRYAKRSKKWSEGWGNGGSEKGRE